MINTNKILSKYFLKHLFTDPSRKEVSIWHLFKNNLEILIENWYLKPPRI